MPILFQPIIPGYRTCETPVFCYLLSTLAHFFLERYSTNDLDSAPRQFLFYNCSIKGNSHRASPWASSAVTHLHRRDREFRMPGEITKVILIRGCFLFQRMLE